MLATGVSILALSQDYQENMRAADLHKVELSEKFSFTLPPIATSKPQARKYRNSLV